MVEFPVPLKGLFRPHYVTWSEQQQIENNRVPDLRNAVRIITETGLRVKKELLPMKRIQIDFLNAVLWIPDSKTLNGVAEIPMTKLAFEAFQNHYWRRIIDSRSFPQREILAPLWACERRA